MKKTASLPRVTVRRMRRTEAAVVAGMMKRLAAFHGDTAKTTPHHFAAYGSGPQRLGDMWLALVDKKPVGFAATYDWMNFVRAVPCRTLDLLYIEEAYRGLHIGQSLIEAIAKDGLKKGIRRLTTSAAKTNKKANAFYKKLGFEKASNHSHRYGIDGVALDRLGQKKKI